MVLCKYQLKLTSIAILYIKTLKVKVWFASAYPKATFQTSLFSWVTTHAFGFSKWVKYY